MKPLHPNFFITILFSLFALSFSQHSVRRILHHPLFPATSMPPPSPPQAPPFFNEFPAGQPPPDQMQSAPSTASNATIANPTATQPAKGTKKVAIAISVGIVTLGMLSALAFFLYKHRAKQQVETQKLVGNGESQRNIDDDGTRGGVTAPSSFLYIGTVEPTRSSAIDPIRSPYHKLNSLKRSDRYRPSPELHPLPPLTKPPHAHFPPPAASPSASLSSDDESNDTAYHSPQNSSLSQEDGYYTPVSRQSSLANGSPAAAKRDAHASAVAPVSFSKRNSPKSRLSVPSPDVRHMIIPPIKKAPPPLPPSLATHDQVASGHSRRPKFSAPPPAPNLTRLQSTATIKPPHKSRNSLNPPPPPPPPPPPQRKTVTPAASVSSSSVSRNEESKGPTPSVSVSVEKGSSEKIGEKGLSSSERHEANETDGAKPKLKPLHWDKVRATSDRATVWDQLKSSSFQ